MRISISSTKKRAYPAHLSMVAEIALIVSIVPTTLFGSVSCLKVCTPMADFARTTIFNQSEEITDNQLRTISLLLLVLGTVVVDASSVKLAHYLGDKRLKATDKD